MDEKNCETPRDLVEVKSSTKDEVNGACSSPEDQKMMNKGTSDGDHLMESGKEVDDCCNGEIYKKKNVSGEQKMEDLTGSSSENEALETAEVSENI